MNKRIMILSSDKTGHGHESIVQALREQFLELQPADIKVINGFSIGGPAGHLAEKLYFPVVKYTPFLWKLFYQFTSHFTYTTDYITAKCIKRSFIKEVRDFMPDVIVTVHPAFVGSVNSLLNRYCITIPVIVVVADLVNLSGIWADYRSACILSPTEEARTKLLAFGADKDKIKVFGFPVRKRFGCSPRLENNQRLKLLVFANAFCKTKTVRIVQNLLNNFDCTVTLLTGRDDSLKSYIEGKLADKCDDGRLHLPGYVVNMEHYMQTCDLLIGKAGPNTVMEAVHCAIPLIITGNLPGQEEGTTEWLVSQGMGAAAKGDHGLIETIGLLIADDRAMLKAISNQQKNYKSRNAASDMARFIREFEAGSSLYSEVACLEELRML